MSRSFAPLCIAGLVLALAACGAKLNPVLDCPNLPLDPSLVDPNGKYSYATDIVPIVNTYCTCHAKGALNRQNAPTRVQLDDFNNIKLFADESRETVLAGTMPPNSNMDPNLRCKFDAWYRNGQAP